jgi:large-conductance mechanosensitive channel
MKDFAIGFIIGYGFVKLVSAVIDIFKQFKNK